MVSREPNDRRCGKIPGYAGYVPRHKQPIDVGPRTDDTHPSKIIPGYTGYIPKNSKFDDSGSKPNTGAIKQVVSGYQGYVPSVGSEILHERTTHDITDRMSGKTKNAGLRITASERFKTTNMEFMKDPGIVQMPKYEFTAKETVIADEKKDRNIPSEAANRFWLPGRPETLSSAARKFFD